MLLKLGDISCFVANWNNKADNLRTIAEQLDLKLDSFVFADDNPAERAVVRRFAPEVAVPDMPEDPAGYVQALLRIAISRRWPSPAKMPREPAITPRTCGARIWPLRRPTWIRS